jgi:CheY-like chemotaxis protein
VRYIGFEGEILENSPRILIVEDEPILALELKEDLQDLGFEVSDVVADGDMVLHAFLRGRPDVVLMDIKLHGFRDGIDSASQIRGFYKTPIVYLSSYAESEVGPRLLRTAPYAFLQKPYELGQLRELISQVIRGSA